jgi:hypothetical protein
VLPSKEPSDALLGAYLPLERGDNGAFGGELPERERYAHVGALLGGEEAADAEMEMSVGQRGRSDFSGSRGRGSFGVSRPERSFNPATHGCRCLDGSGGG